MNAAPVLYFLYIYIAFFTMMFYNINSDDKTNIKGENRYGYSLRKTFAQNKIHI